MDAFDRLDQQAEEDERLALSRFGPIPSTARKVSTKEDLEALRMAKVGYVVNIRGEHSKIHRAGCETLQAMMTTEHRKFFCADAPTNTEWIKTGREGTWDHCGRCGGARS